MAVLTIAGNPVNTIGDLPVIGEKAPDFILTKTDLSDIRLADLQGKKILLNIFPSIDTPICSLSVQRFNAEAGNLTNTMVLCVSMDLPFAHARFCEIEGLKDVIPVSEIRNRQFGDGYGVRMKDGPLAGLFARAVIILDENGIVRYSMLVKELKTEPDYEAVLDFFRKK